MYATLDGGRYRQLGRSYLPSVGRVPTITAARTVPVDDLSPVEDRETRERYAAEAERMAAGHDPDDPV